MEPPRYTVFPVDEANKVFAQLNKCEITGRAVLQVSQHDSDIQTGMANQQAVDKQAASQELDTNPVF